jgi:Fe-S-cluster containining protein
MKGRKGRRSASSVGNIILKMVRAKLRKCRAFRKERKRDCPTYNDRPVRCSHTEVSIDGK